MFYSLKLYLRDRWTMIPAVAAAVLQAINWWYVATRIHPQAEQIFLHYNIIFGVDLIGEWWKIFYLSAMGTLALLVNYAISLWFYSSDKILSRLLSFFTLMFEVFLLVAVVVIVGMNI